MSESEKTQYEMNGDLLSRRDVTVSMVMRVQKLAVQEALEALSRLEAAADEDLKITSISKQMRRAMEDYRRGLTVLRKEVDGTPFFSEKSNWMVPVSSKIQRMENGRVIEDLDSEFVLDVQIAMFAVSLNWWLAKDDVGY